MIEGLALTLLNTLAAYLFEGALEYSVNVRIDGAPSWYMVREDEMICSNAYLDGSYSQVDYLKMSVHRKLESQLQDGLDRSAYENFENISENSEKEIVHKFKNDPKLSSFVKNSTEFKHIVYREDEGRIFAKGCIKNSKIITYIKERFVSAKKDIAIYKSNKAFDELESE
ncbi:hypothetical protein ThvES_00006480 [Thiovulum sp. ES]|nr:hypothetical protein ThvES_00006480 [Thiovulum sp. ES]